MSNSAQCSTIPALWQRVQHHREPAIGRSQHYLSANSTHLSYQRSLLLPRSCVLDDGVADPGVEVAVRQPNRTQIGLDELNARELGRKPVCVLDPATNDGQLTLVRVQRLEEEMRRVVTVSGHPEVGDAGRRARSA